MAEHPDSADDPFCERVGVDLVRASDGAATAELTLAESHLNVHGTPHGGALYTLADAAFSAASNAGDADAVALETSMSYLEACGVGEMLTASAERRHDRGRTALFAVAVRDEAGDLVAEFRGRVYKVGSSA